MEKLNARMSTERGTGVITGIYAANITPMDPGGRVDIHNYLQHAEWLLSRGVQGLVPFGTNGEGPTLSTSEKIKVLGELLRAFPGVPIIPAVMEGNLSASLELVRSLQRRPVQAFLVLPPYYYKPAPVAGLINFYRQLIEAVQVPVIAYHVPKYAVPIEIEVLHQTSLWGVKESEGNVDYALAVQAMGKEVLLGTEDQFLTRLSSGAAGAISALANIVPELVMACYHAVRDDRSADAQRLSAALMGLRTLTKTHPTVAVLKYLAGERQQLDFGAPRDPLASLSAGTDLSLLRSEIRATCN